MDRKICVRFSRRLGASAGRGVGRGEVCYGGGRKRPMARVTAALRRQVDERAPPPVAAAAAGPDDDALGTTATPKLLSHCSALPRLNHAVPAHPRLLSITPILVYRELLTFPNISI